MAHPGYPMQPMQPMPPPMGGPGGPMPAPMARRGTSKAVPVVVSAGLAIGVFCGLLFGLGLPEDEATAATSTTASTKPKTEEDVPEPFQPTTKDVKVPKPGGDSGGGSGAAVADGGSAAGAGSGSAAAEPPKPVKAIGKLTVVVKPEAVAKTAKIYVDDKELEDNVFEVDLTDRLDADKKEARTSVAVKVKAPGYKDYEQSVDIVAHPDQEEATRFEVELVKRPATVRPPRPPPPGQPKCKKPPCGLIDI
jgi:hypothetical protein